MSVIAPRIIADLAAAEAEGVLINEEMIVERLKAMPQDCLDLIAWASRGKILVRA